MVSLQFIWTMLNLYVLCGPPASGKTTLSKKLKLDDENFVRLSYASDGWLSVH